MTTLWKFEYKEGSFTWDLQKPQVVQNGVQKSDESLKIVI